MNPADVIHFWFDTIGPSGWFKKDPHVDQQIRDRFYQIYEAASRCELWTWRATAEGRLAEIILLDQFPRNMFRGQARAFATDPLSVALAQECESVGADRELLIDKRAFVYMPYMHSESLLIHDLAVRAFSQPGLENNLDFEWKHKAILERFGRYPHRNKALGRESTNEEIEFLSQPGSSF